MAVIAANLVALVVLIFIYPHLMVSPGALVRGHAELATDCFACHSPWFGAASARCAKCHSAPDIGLRTTKGLPLADRTVKRAFHRELIEQDCTACHSDHAGPKLTHRSRKPFSHALLRAAVRVRCESCHAKPADTIHQELGVGCAQCHKAESWKPATFKHALLADAVLARCEGCHKTPVDSLHRQVKGNCKQCHSQDHWKPATFDHDKLFLLDRDHTTECATCHTNDEYSRYTCYGCHEHRQDKVRSEHEEEGIRDFENCVECHRSASDKSEKKGSHRGTKRD
jgi:hypothetical protein